MKKRLNINSKIGFSQRSGCRTKRGFTIIEVVLVLAIAGLIMMMVFIALPGLQRSQRDSQRTQDISRLAAALAQYQSNNRGKLPTADNINGSFKKRYLTVNGDTFEDPDGLKYTIKREDCTSDCNNKTYDSLPQYKATSNTRTITVFVKARCTGNEDNPITYQSNTRKAAVTYVKEGGGVICVDV